MSLGSIDPPPPPPKAAEGGDDEAIEGSADDVGVLSIFIPGRVLRSVGGCWSTG